MTKLFIPLRVHSDYSLGRSSTKIPELVEHCRRHAIPAVALADHGNMFGALEFAMLSAKSGIQPITAAVLEFELLPPSSSDSDQVADATGESVRGTFLILAKSEIGYRHLVYLASLPHLREGGGILPFADLCAHSRDLIVIMGDRDSLFAKVLLQAGDAAAMALISGLSDGGAECYIELQRYTDGSHQALEQHLLRFAHHFHLPLVATNPVFFLKRDGHQACDTLLCISQGTYLGVEDRAHVHKEHYCKDQAELRRLFYDVPEAIENTVVIAKKCHFILEGAAPQMPHFDEGGCEYQMLESASRAGLQHRIAHIFDGAMIDTYQARLSYELGVIEKMGFSGYFLIVSDFIRWSKLQDIPVGPGRGSGAGSIIAWALGITEVDPIAFGLLFERFLNPERISMPDFDIDFCQSRRDEVIAYVRSKYGKERVAHIVTFGKLQARAVLRDVGRVLQMSYSQVDRICKMVPNNPAAPITLRQAIDIDKELQRLRDSEQDVATLFNIALQLEGVSRHASLHAAGVIIAAKPIVESVPLYRAADSEVTAVQFNMKYAEAAGLMKFDFLGLKTLTMLKDACALIHQQRDEVIELPTAVFNDDKTYELLSQGRTIGVFQFEGVGMREAIRRLRPSTIHDLIALASLYRPGPMDNIPQYINRKHGVEPIDYIHPDLREVLEETYGIIIYQEQVIKIVQILAGYSLGEADLVRRAMGKKNQAEMEVQRRIFVQRAVAMGLNETRAVEIFDIVDKFAGYGFNKSHATAYAVIGYHTAYLKANYPQAFFVASINLDISDSDKIAVLCNDARGMGIAILPPDINRSSALFSIGGSADVDGDGAGQIPIVFGLVGIKGVGIKIMEEVIAERKKGGVFSSLADFISRCFALGVNRRTLENLARAGALASITPNAAEVLANIDAIMAYAQELRRNAERLAGTANGAGGLQTTQMSLFALEDIAGAEPKLTLQPTAPWSFNERMQLEYQSLGFYLTDHPLSPYADLLRRERDIVKSEEMVQRIEASGNEVAMMRFAGVVTGCKIRSGKGPRGGKYAFIQLSDQYGSVECSIFSEDLLNSHPYIAQEGSLVLVRLSAKIDDRGARLIIEGIQKFDDFIHSQPQPCRIEVTNPEALTAVASTYIEGSRSRGRRADATPHDVVVVVRLQLGEIYLRSREHWLMSFDQIKALQTIGGVSLSLE